MNGNTNRCHHRSRNCAHRAAREIIAMMAVGDAELAIGVIEKHWRELVLLAGGNAARLLSEGFYIIDAPTGVFVIAPVRDGMSPRWITADEFDEIRKIYKPPTAQRAKQVLSVAR